MCGHASCEECIYDELGKNTNSCDKVCIQCGLRIQIVELLNLSTDISNDSDNSNPQCIADNYPNSLNITPHTSCDRNKQSNNLSLNLNLLSPNDYASYRSHSTRSNTSIGESEMSFCSVHTANSQEEKRFVCHFHGQNIISKHHTKNKF